MLDASQSLSDLSEFEEDSSLVKVQDPNNSPGVTLRSDIDSPVVAVSSPVKSLSFEQEVHKNKNKQNINRELGAFILKYSNVKITNFIPNFLF
jgi:hypothetical protein